MKLLQDNKIILSETTNVKQDYIILVHHNVIKPASLKAVSNPNLLLFPVWYLACSIACDKITLPFHSTGDDKE